MTKIKIKNQEITINLSNNGDDYISLTDMAKYKDPQLTGIIIANWLRTSYTIDFIGFWEQMHNKSFNVIEFDNIRNQVGSNGFIISSKKWI